ncbi:hypothetical protein ACLOJK_022255 [Asimina triloba]
MGREIGMKYASGRDCGSRDEMGLEGLGERMLMRVHLGLKARHLYRRRGGAGTWLGWVGVRVTVLGYKRVAVRCEMVVVRYRWVDQS